MTDRERKGPSHRVFRCLTLFNKLTAAAILFATGLSGVLGAMTDWPVGPIAKVVLGAVAALLLGFHMLNFETRAVLGHFEIAEIFKSFCAELALGYAVPAWILFALLNVPARWELFAAISIVLALAFFFYEPVQEAIRREVERKGYPQGTTYFGALHPWRFISTDDIHTIATTRHHPNLQSLLAFFVGDPWLVWLSRTRTVILCVLFFASVTALAGAASVGLQDRDGSREEGGGGRKEQPQPEVPRVSSPPPGTVESAPEPAAHDLDRPDAGEWRCRRMPGDGAPDWAKSELNALYVGGLELNATPPPGRRAGGCSDGAVVPARTHGTFVYAVARGLDGAILSVAVNSLRFGPAIFLAPAAQRVLELIEAGEMPIGGYPRVDAGDGDMVPILTLDGTIVLVRPAKHLPERPRYASPYVELAPTVAAAWTAAMNEVDSWLWPIRPTVARGVATFDLLRGPAAGGEELFEVFHDRHTGIARRGPYAYYPPQAQLGQAELEQRAEAAR